MAQTLLLVFFLAGLISPMVTGQSTTGFPSTIPLTTEEEARDEKSIEFVMNIFDKNTEVETSLMNITVSLDKMPNLLTHRVVSLTRGWSRLARILHIQPLSTDTANTATDTTTTTSTTTNTPEKATDGQTGQTDPLGTTMKCELNELGCIFPYTYHRKKRCVTIAKQTGQTDPVEVTTTAGPTGICDEIDVAMTCEFPFTYRGNKKCVTIGETKVGLECIFPFTYRGKAYSKCTIAGDVRNWCSTKVDANGNHVPGNWRYCPQFKHLPPHFRTCQHFVTTSNGLVNIASNSYAVNIAFI